MDKETATVITKDTQINFIRFIFNKETDKQYYSRPYIKACEESWRREFPNMRIILVEITPKLKNSNIFSQKTQLSCYTTDPLRLIICNNYDNCVYCDTDEYMLEGSGNILRKYMNNYNNFVAGECSGTILWNRYKNSMQLNNWIKLYNFIGQQKNFDSQQHGDIEMYGEFRDSDKRVIYNIKDCRKTGLFHFSSFYPAIMYKMPLYCLLNRPKKFDMECGINKGKKTYFPIPIDIISYLESAIHYKYNKKIIYLTEEKEPSLYFIPMSTQEYIHY